MTKKTLTDGLVQLAIVLSLLRTDLVDNYLNSYYNRYPEIQEIVLGTSSAYTQTHFHNHNWQSQYGGVSYHKNIDNYFIGDVFRELRTLGSGSRFRRLETDVPTWLISNPPTPLVSDTASEVSVAGVVNGHSDNQNDINNVATQSSHQASASTQQDETANDIALETPIERFLGDELTKEDMDLIEVLWRQDMDLGVGREMFDINLRKELEKEQEIELQKQREREKELELLQSQTEEKPLDTSDIINYIVDSETGETMPASSVTTASDGSLQPIPEALSPFDGTDEGLSIEEAMRLLEEQDPNPVVPAMNVSQVKKEPEYTQNLTNTTHSANTFTENFPELQQNYQRQSSFEQRWQDIATVLNLPPPSHALTTYINNNNNNNNNYSFPENPGLHNANISLPEPDIDMPLMHNDSSIIQGNVSFAAEINAPLPPSNGNNLFDLDSQEFMFTNVTNTTQPDTYNQSSALLQELLSDDITNLQLPELVDGLHMHMVDDASSDSAVSSMDSITSHVQDMNEFNDTSSVTSYIGSIGVSPSIDGIEGATGGEYDATCSKYVKYEKYDYDQNDDGTYSDFSFPEDVLLNQSSSSNESECSFKAADMRHVRHNHTYPLQPGQPPKEPYNKPKRDSKSRMHSRDEMRAKKMNIPLTIDQIINSAVEEFNDLLQKYLMTDQQLQLVRDIRRRGKNKVAAQNCRKRKMDVLTTLETEVDDMAEERNKLKRDHHRLESEVSQMRSKFQHLYQEVFQSLRDDNGQPYDPSQYSLQQSSDGNVFLVPRNSTAADSVKKDKHTKKKSVRK